MKTARLFLSLFIAALLLTACDDGGDKDTSGDFGTIQVPDVSQLEQSADAEDSQTPSGVTFTTQDAWTSAISDTRADTPDWISISPDHGDAPGTYTIQINLEPNTGEEARTAVITIVCGPSKIEISVTQKSSGDKEEDEGDEGDTRAPNGRLAHITEYDAGELESIMVFSYDGENRLVSVKCYSDTELSDPIETWEFTYDGSTMTVTEKHYDKPPQAYGTVWVCNGSFAIGNPSFITSATSRDLNAEENTAHRIEYAYEYNNNEQLTDIYKDYYYEDTDTLDRVVIHYVYQDEICTQIRWSGGDTQTYIYDEEIRKDSNQHERLFAQYMAIDPALLFTEEPDMLRALGFFGYQGNRMPTKVETTWGSNVITQQISYRYNDLSNWKIGKQIDGMEISIRDNAGNDNLRYVLTFDGI